MKGLKRFIIVGIMLTTMTAAGLAADRRPVTPYGDFCPACSRYGFCKIRLTVAQARNALKQYYAQKGFTVKIEEVHGRFIKATVYDRGKIIDKILFDRRSGRIRSIY